jgi:hypothetical protein
MRCGHLSTAELLANGLQQSPVFLSKYIQRVDVKG